MTETSPGGAGMAHPPAGIRAGARRRTWTWRAAVRPGWPPGVEMRIVERRPTGREPALGRRVRSARSRVRGPVDHRLVLPGPPPPGRSSTTAGCATGEPGHARRGRGYLPGHRPAQGPESKSGGEWISSVGAGETKLLDTPGVLEAAVVGIPDERWDERPLGLRGAPPRLGRGGEVGRPRSWQRSSAAKVARWQGPRVLDPSSTRYPRPPSGSSTRKTLAAPPPHHAGQGWAVQKLERI